MELIVAAAILGAAIVGTFGLHRRRLPGSAAAAGGRDELARLEERLGARAEELEAALGLLRHRFRGGVLEGERERERALGMLVRKGYELELAYDAVRAFERAAA